MFRLSCLLSTPTVHCSFPFKSVIICVRLALLDLGHCEFVVICIIAVITTGKIIIH